ncbi:LuxR family two component transcriptional regulator [Shimia isoporae]|uniref:LuxR family two component transcriptional regulator n=1 Tax=Shimia isoporae TaxID=647720 RepID=A0A4R1N0T3_9RHOB|nr:response regulator transcription factor [Shimia isoporae]TCK99304.1 LuxR family two component transcriptional regulator [Shimia isoporae]
MRLLIAEDDKLHREFLERVARAVLPDVEAVTVTPDGSVALEAFESEEFDSVILDLQMPNVTGVDAAKAIWARSPATRILFWSNYAEEAYIRGVTRIVPPAAVYGYVLKTAPEEQLKLAIQGVFVAEQCVIDREVRGVQQRAHDRFSSLTDLEYEALVDLCLGLTDKTMAARRKVSLRGAQSRLQHLYQKLGLDRGDIPQGEFGPSFNARTRAIFLALSRGILNADTLRREETQFQDWLDKNT